MIARAPLSEYGRQLVHMAAGTMALMLRVNNDVLNFLNTAIAAGAAILLARGI
jgi:hypothetical protein